jgi:hypothetical protein
MDVSQPKLPASLGYPLATSQIEACLQALDLRATPSLHYWTPQRFGSLLQAHYWLPNPRIPQARVYLRVGSIPRESLERARNLASARALPALRRWLQALEALPEG